MNDVKPSSGSGVKALVTMLVLLAAGGVGLGITASRGDSWLAAAFTGWLAAGMLGLLGWWTFRKALSSGEHRTFMKYVVGGMGVRFMLCGVLAGVVAGTRALDVKGFVTGLLVGIAVFIAVEVGSLALGRRLVPGEGG
jgi:hypothetical protein